MTHPTSLPRAVVTCSTLSLCTSLKYLDGEDERKQHLLYYYTFLEGELVVSAYVKTTGYTILIMIYPHISHYMYMLHSFDDTMVNSAPSRNHIQKSLS